MIRILLVAILFAFPASASENEVVQQVEEYLNGLSSFEADFEQSNAQGESGSGRFYLKKPGKFRWEYETGQPILIISDGKQLIYYDKQLKEATYVPAKHTLAGFLAREKISLSGDVKLVEATETDSSMKVVVTQKAKPEEGSLALTFTKNPMQLSGMVVTEQSGQRNVVDFKNPVFDGKVDDKKFVFRNPKFFKEIGDR